VRERSTIGVNERENRSCRSIARRCRIIWSKTNCSGIARVPSLGALIDKPGLFHEANGGTLFLDEINSLSMMTQSKQLRVLQDQEFRPLGSTKSRTVDVKIVAATNTSLRHLGKV
jgi:transcriptional regulator with AAA-type ATPase domain